VLHKLINSTELYFILVVISQSADATAAEDSLVKGDSTGRRHLFIFYFLFKALNS